MKRLFTLLILVIGFQALYGQDTIVLYNGDVIHGEVKSLSKGVLKMETPYSDSDFKIEWLHVNEFYSRRTFSITLTSGLKPTGKLNTIAPGSDTLEILQFINFVHVTLPEVVEITPLEKSFLGRLDANLDIGFYYAKSNNLTQLTSSGSFGYFSDKWGGKASFNVLNSTQDETEPTRRKDADVSFRRNLKGKIYGLVKANFLQNNEIQLDLRSTYELGLGSFFVNTNTTNMGLSLGGAFNNEKYNDSLNSDKQSIEGFMTLTIDLFDTGDLSFFMEGTAYPGITERGRWRADLNTNLKYDLPWDFYIKLSYTHNFDNQPVEGSPENDFVFQTSFGWEL